MTPGSRAAATARGRRVSITDPATIDLHCELVAREMRAGRVIPFLGAGANLCGRPEEHVWNPLRFDWLPSGKELAKYLAGLFAYQGKHPDDLLKVSQYIKLMVGAFPLYAELRKLFNGDYPPTALHEFLAEVPTILRRHLHHPPEGETTTILDPNRYSELSVGKRTVILKIHGAVNREDESRDSFVITEDHYIDYLARTDVSKLFPVTLVDKLRRSHCQFLGYGLQDWNLRVILNRIWGEEKLRSTSWAIQLNPDRLDQLLWSNRDVTILNVPLEDYIVKLRAAFLTVVAGAGRAP